MARATPGITRRLLVAGALLAAAAPLLLLAPGGRAASPLTLQSITVDGSVSDWAAVLANPLQTTHDGDGSSWDATECAAFSTDRDCPVGGGVGNDLYTFAWTYDTNYVYLYVERYGGETTGVDFFFAADTDQDQRLEATGDVVLRAQWKGGTGGVTVEAGPYVPVNSVSGDPLANASGYVDGYKLPGNNGTLKAITCGASGITATGAGVTTGPGAGRQAEIRIPWCAFGVPAQQPFLWHVASSNTVALTGVVDNIGAPSGKLGTFVQRAVAFFPDRSGAVLSPGSVTYDHTLRNDGNEADAFQFTATSSQGGKVELLDGAVVIGRDDQGDGTWELTPQVSLAVGASKPLQVRITLPTGRTGQDVTRVTATSVNDATVSATVTETSHVGSPAFVPEAFSAWTKPGVAAVFAETLVNGQLAADTFDLTASAGCAGDELRITTDAAGTQLVARDDTGDGTWDFVDPAAHTNGALDALGLPDMGPVAGLGQKQFWLWVTPPAGAPYGACSVRLAVSSPATTGSAWADHVVTVAPSVTFTPSYTRAAGTSRRAGVGSSVFFPAVIRNSEGVARAYTLSQVLTPSGSGASTRVWTDPNGDGSPADGAVITSTGTVAPAGGAQSVVIELLAGTAPSGAALSVVTTATATEGGASATQTSEADVGYLSTYTDALLTQASSVFAPCATVYLRGSGLKVSDSSSYTLRWLDASQPAPVTVRTVSPWPTTALGTANDSWPLPQAAPTGTWTARLTSTAENQDLSFAVELSASVTALGVDRARYRPGDTVQVSAAFQNTGRVALEGGALHYALDGAPLRTRSGVTVASGATASDPFSFTLPLGSAPGVRTLSAGWWLSCGTSPFATRSATLEVQPDPPVITAPASGARLASHTPPIGGTALAGASVTVSINGSSYAPVTATGAGTWSFTPPSLADGTWSATATQTVAGVPSEPSAAVSFTIDTTPPAAPAVGAIGSPTRADPVVASVTAEAGSIVTVYANGAPLTSTPASVSGGTYTFHLVLGEGTFSIQAAAADDLGNTSPLSAARSVVVDRTPPLPPVIDGFAAPTRADPVPVLATAAAGSTVRLLVDGIERAVMSEGTPGRFAATLDLPVDGSYSLTATAADAVGNVSGASDPVALVVDRQAPDAPVVAPVASPTNAEPVVVAVTAELGASVALALDGAPSGVSPNVSGTNFTFPLAGLGDGSYTVQATATDAAGNGSLPSNLVSFEVDRTPPGVPTLAPIATPTRLQPVPVTVTADAGSTVRISVDGVLSAATPVLVSGTSYSFELTLAEGTRSVTATAADALGNTSAPSAARVVVVDRTPPAVPVVAPPLPAATNDDLVLVEGTAEAGSTVTVTVSGAGAAPTPAPVVATGGTFSVAVDFTIFADGLYTITVKATDTAGNASASTAAASVRLDRASPDAPVIAAVPSPTSANPLVVRLTAEAGVAVVLTVDGVPQPLLAPASVVGNSYEFELYGLADGSHEVTAVATDAAGNASGASNLVSFEVDTTLTAIPIVSVASPTRADPVLVTATAEEGVTVVLYVDDVPSGVIPTTSGTTYTFSLSALAEGEYVLNATADDGVHTSAPSADRLLVVDRTPPSLPTISGLPAATNALSLALSGTAEPGAVVTMEVGSTPHAATADALGNWSATVPLPAGAGPMTVAFDYWATDAAGNASGTVLGELQVDRAPPPVPSIAPLTSPTNAASVDVVVTAEAGATVRLLVGGADSGLSPAVSGGGTTYTFAFAPVDGSYSLTATAADALGNTSAPSPTVGVELDRTAPPVPTIDPVVTPTKAAEITVVVHAEPGSTVSLFLNDVEQAALAPDSVSGGTYTFSFDPGEGTAAIQATAADALGNVSARSASVVVVVDRTPPAQPAIAPIASPTRAAEIAVVVTTDAGATVTLYLNDAEQVGLAPATVSGGTYTFLFDPGEGTHEVKAKAADALGNASSLSAPRTVTVDRTAPAQPTIAAIPSPTNAPNVTAVVTAEAGSTVVLYVDGVQSPAVPVVSGATHTFTWAPAADGTYSVQATAADALGNVSALSDAVTVDVDRTPPPAPSIAQPTSPTNAPSVTAVVTAEAGSTVVLYVDGVQSVAVPSVSGTAYTFTLDPGEGSSTLQATAADALGNVSTLSSPVTVVVDRTAPNVPSIAALATPTRAASVPVVVSAEAGATVKLWVNGAETGLVPSIAGETYTFTWAPVADGTYALQATAADALGNASAKSPGRTVEIDRTGPALAPTVNGLPAATNAASVALWGTAEPATTVTVAVAGLDPAYALVAGDGSWSADVPLPAADADAVAVTATAVDAAGNASPAFVASVRIDRTAPGVPLVAQPTTPTKAASVPVVVTADAGSTVVLWVNGAPTALAPTVAGGTYTFAWAPAGEGSWSLQATAADAVGNLSALSAAVTVLVDRTAPAAPTVGAIASPTAAATVTVVVSAEAGATVTLYDDGVASAAVPTVSGTTYTFAFDPGEGSSSIQARATDAAGNVSALSGAQAVVVDRTAPAAPAIGVLTTPTNAAQLTVVVTAEVGASVKLWVNGVQTSLVPSVAGGTFSFTWAPATDGSYTLEATAADSLGNVSAKSSGRTVVVDRTAPATPTIGAITSPTRDATVTAVVTAEAGATVKLWVNGVETALVPTVSGGTYTFSWAPSADGAYGLQATAADALGNVSATSATQTVVVDRTAPGTPTVAPILPSPTNAAVVNVAVTAGAGATVKLWVNGVETSLAPSVSGATYTFAWAPPADGTWSVQATAADALGNTSPLSAARTVTVDRTAPAVPSLTPPASPTNAATISAVVTAEAGATVVLYVDGLQSAVPPTVSGTTYTFVLDPGEGSSALQATAADALGNVSPLSAPVTVEVDRTAPGIPSIGPVPSPTRAASLPVVVTAEAGSTVKLWVNGVETSLVPVVAGGEYTFTWAPAADGTWSVQATAADALGNVSARSASVAVVVDRTGPAQAPTVAGLPSTTNAASVALSGTAEAGATVTIAVAGMAPVTATAGAGGSWSATVPLPAADGSATVTVTAVDGAGNPSPSFTGSVTIDRAAPAAAVIGAPAEGASLPAGTVSVTGTAEAGATVTVVVDGVPHVVTADSAGAFQVDVTLADGDHAVSVTVTDAAGNVSAQADRSFVVATPPPPSDGGGGCGCTPGGTASPEALVLVALGLGLFRRRRVR